MSVPKVLLIVHCDLTGNGIGSLFLRDVISCYPAGRMLCYTTIPFRPSSPETIVCGCRTLVRRVPSSRWPVAAGYLDWRFRGGALARQVDEIEDLARRESVDLIWSVLGAVSTIHLSCHLMKRINVPLVCTEWDSPQYFALCLPMSLLPWDVVFDEYRWLLERAVRVSVMSETGRRVFREQYNVDAIPWTHGIRSTHWRPARAGDATTDLAIAFAGSLYCKREWNALMQALHRARWTVQGRNARVHFIGRFPRLFARRGEGVVEHGPQTFPRTLDLLASMDIAYLPYWLDPKWSYAVRTAFPSKLTSYVAAGLPLLYHGPRDSSVSRFLQDYPVGLECDTLNPSTILRCLERLAGDQSLLDRATAARQSALENELGHHVMLARFAQLLGIDRGELREDRGIAA
jgi:hypothetical protein